MMATLISAGWKLAATLLAPGLRLQLRRRAAHGREIRSRLAERRGIDATPRPPGSLIWLHAASVGETMSILPILTDLVARTSVLVTTGTVTAQRLLDQRLSQTHLQGRILHRFAPLDVPAWVARFLSHWQPDAAVFVESELWPNQLAACQARGIPLMLINARMSDRSYRAWRRCPPLAKRILGAFTQIQARGPKDAERFRALGAKNVQSIGDLKFAAPPLPVDQEELVRLRGMLSGRPAWLAASTHPGEEALIARVHRSLVSSHPGLLTIIVPRHPERGAELAAEFESPCRSRGDEPPGEGIWIADTLGELGLWYRLAPVVLIGRSLLPPGGGQNPLEPARLGCSIAAGPYMSNFADHVALLRQAGALAEVSDVSDLARFVSAMLSNPNAQRCTGKRAAAAIQGHQDLPAQTAKALLALLPS